MEKAIKKAIEGGYTYNCAKGLFTKGDGMECYFSGVNSDYTVWTRKDNDSSICVSHEDTLLDPLFWQALFPDTKVKCWACEGEKFFKDIFTQKPDPKRPCGNCEETGKQIYSEWKEKWYCFIDHLAAGKDINTFFDNLLQ